MKSTTLLDSVAIRGQFPSLKRKHNNLPITYLDGPGGTQVPESVIQAMVNYYRESNANTHGSFHSAIET
ncbi:MAG TPA: aminotransferase class V-fold PLP-dependent enzyme, partial [Cyclobacteriaceae bacterium]|nr:aminotransferase class V-fold PLP-dependent enzyme [Cyclobacteriaceae bacterium]